MEQKHMTVAEVIERLRAFPPDALACYEGDAGYEAVTDIEAIDNGWVVIS